MRNVRSANTSPEMVVRSVVHRLGYRFRLHRRDLPGRPDLVLPRLQKVIFVHGCFWHQHRGCHRQLRPKSNRNFWQAKFDANMTRDRRAIRALRRTGWSVLVVWECETRKGERLEQKLQRFLSNTPALN